MKTKVLAGAAVLALAVGGLAVVTAPAEASTWYYTEFDKNGY